MGPTANDIDRMDTVDAIDDDTDTDTLDAVVIVSVASEDMDTTRAQIEQTRAEMGDTIEAIKDRLNPENLVQQARDTVREAAVGKAHDAANAVVGTAKDTGTSFVEFIKENPVPAALTAMGVTWLVLSARGRNTGQRHYEESRPTYGYGPGYPGYGEPQSGRSDGGSAASQALGRVGDVAGQVQDKAGQIVDQVQDKAGRIVDQAQDKAGEIVDQVQDRAGQIAGQVQQQVSQLGAQAQYQGQRAMDWFQRLLHENPLAAGAAAVAVGTAIGLVVPETPQESRWMGAMRDSVVQKAQQTAHDVLEDKAHQVADAVSDKVHDMAQEAVDKIG